ncbi:hypothetical protein, partial [Escherichia coli]|uniref:hypothetical protein n=1 Tax=Escherichia coli TaxID=562 RepID=UPI0038557B54
SIKNDGHYFCRAGGNRPDGLNEPVTVKRFNKRFICQLSGGREVHVHTVFIRPFIQTFEINSLPLSPPRCLTVICHFHAR